MDGIADMGDAAASGFEFSLANGGSWAETRQWCQFGPGGVDMHSATWAYRGNDFEVYRKSTGRDLPQQ